MATASRIGGSGDWNTASNWSDGVPTAADDAVIGGGSTQANETITGGGTAGSLDIRPDRRAYGLALAGTYTLGSFLDDQAQATLAPAAALSFGAGTVTDGGVLTPGAGASLGTGTLDNGTLANPILLPAPGVVDVSGAGSTAAIFAGTGPAVLLGGAGADYVQVGGGQATLFAGAGADLIGVVNGAGGSLVVSGFRVGVDHVSAQGYAAGPTVTAVRGRTVLGFSDHAQVTLLGVASLPPSAYSSAVRPCAALRRAGRLDPAPRSRSLAPNTGSTRCGHQG